MSAELYSLVMR